MSAIPSTETPVKIYYVPSINAYFFKYSHAVKYGPVEEVTTKFRYWADPRPLLPTDLELVKAAKTLPEDVRDRFTQILRRSLTIVNVNNDNILDMVFEFMTNGEILCAINYDMFNDRYFIIPGKLGASLMLLDFAYGNIVLTDEHCSKIYDIRKGEDYPVYIAVTRDGRTCGVAIEQNGRLAFARKWVPVRPEETLRCLDRPKTSLRKLYELNLEYILEREEKTRRVVQYFEEKHSRKGILSFSGGKDSLLALCLLVNAGSRADVVHIRLVNADPPGLDRYIDTISSRLGVDIVVLEARWEQTCKYLQELGMPSRGNRWCTPLLKFVNMLRYIKSRYDLRSIVSYVGSRKSETIKRSIRPATYIDSEAGLLTHAVCYKFPKLLEYLYIWYRAKLPLFRDYMLGIERVSCVTCPFKSCHEIKVGAQEYPEVYELWLPHIKRLLLSMLRSERDLERALQVHLWRFYLLHSDAQYIAKRAGVKIVEPYQMQLNAIQDAVKVTVLEKRRIVLKIHVRQDKRLSALHRIVTALFPDVNTELTEKETGKVLLVSCLGMHVEAREDGTIVAEFSQDRVELLINVLKLCYMVLACLECEHCLYNCPEDAIRLPFDIDLSKCSKCLRCLDACVPARYLFDMIIMSEITSIKYARERIEKIRERYKEILVKMRLESDIEWLKW